MFLDCKWCDHNYIKTVIPYVNYVRNKDEADVHIFVRRQINGGGGSVYKIDFIGHGVFEGNDELLTFISPVDETKNETRQARSGTIAMGLMKYVASTPVGRNIKISFEDKEVPERILQTTVDDDPWKSWVFRLRANGSLRDDANYKRRELKTSFSADKVTPDIKTQFDVEYEYSNTQYLNVDFEKMSKSWQVKNLTVWSLNDHWSAGGRIGSNGTFHGNYIYHLSFGPAIEYNIYPYKESIIHQIRIQYGVSGILNNYYRLSIFEKTSEFVYSHHLSVSGGINKEWGNGYLHATYSSYLHDFELYNISAGGSINYRIYKGISINFRASSNKSL